MPRIEKGILGLGEVCVDWVAIVDHFPEPDEKIDSKTQDLFSGGVTANYITATRRLGADSRFFGAIGNDSYGDFLIEDFKKEGVDYSFVVNKKNAKTPVNFIFVVETSGEKVIIQSPYMHTTIPNIEDFNSDVLEGIKLIHTTGIYPDIAKKAFSMAKERDIKISFDLEKQVANWKPELIKSLLKDVDVLMPNKAGAMYLSGASNPIDAAKYFLKLGVSLVVITLGDEGAIAISNKEKIKVPPQKVRVVDTTGAGDTFCGAFDVAYNIKQFPLEESLQFANTAAGIKLKKLGARTGMPTYEQVKIELEKQGLNFA